jgi:hypothetical protein
MGTESALVARASVIGCWKGGQRYGTRWVVHGILVPSNLVYNKVPRSISIYDSL